MEVRRLEALWCGIKKEAATSQNPLSRNYRALGETAIGVRASYLPPEDAYELLVEVPIGWQQGRKLPTWRGIRLVVLPQVLEPRQAYQLSLVLTDNEAREIFFYFVADLVTALEGVTDPDYRVESVVQCLERWNRFFEKSGLVGLSANAQRGLLAELLWMDKLLDAGVDQEDSVSAWQGCQRAYHDYDLSGRITEVKSTIGKEPRQVIISNERQLDSRGLTSLHLYVATFQQNQGGWSLPDVVSNLRQRLGATARVQFDRRLVSAGYLDSHEPNYSTGYMTKEEELFSVQAGFPRIIDLPDSLGNLRYSVVLSGCQPFRVDIDGVLGNIQESPNV